MLDKNVDCLDNDFWDLMNNTLTNTHTYETLHIVVILPAERCSRSDVNIYTPNASIICGEGMALGCRSAEEAIGKLCELSLGSRLIPSRIMEYQQH